MIIINIYWKFNLFETPENKLYQDVTAIYGFRKTLFNLTKNIIFLNSGVTKDTVKLKYYKYISRLVKNAFPSLSEIYKYIKNNNNNNNNKIIQYNRSDYKCI